MSMFTIQELLAILASDKNPEGLPSEASILIVKKLISQINSRTLMNAWAIVYHLDSDVLTMLGISEPYKHCNLHEVLNKLILERIGTTEIHHPFITCE